MGVCLYVCVSVGVCLCVRTCGCLCLCGHAVGVLECNSFDVFVCQVNVCALVSRAQRC